MRLSVYIFLMLLVASVTFAAGEDEAKIKELEQKIEALQHQLDSVNGASEQVEELKRQVAILAEEVEKLRSGEQAPELTDLERQSLGLGPSAATVYGKKQGVSLAGYGEMLYQNFADKTHADLPSGSIDQLDFLRGVVYVGYRFNDRFLFNSEIEFEHANTEDGGEAAIEFAHIDYRASENFTVRGGMVLMPLGFINEFHEPNVYLGANRPYTETVIIPTTWRENGFGFAGKARQFTYRAYLTNGMKSSGFSAAGLEEGKQEGALAKMTTPSFSGRVDVAPAAGLLLGGSIFAGNSGFFSSETAEKTTEVDESDLKVGTFIGEIHGDYRARGLQLRALYARASLSDVDKLNEALYLTGSESVGESLVGGYVQAGYDLLSGREMEAALIPYFRFESVNTQASVPSGYEKDPANAQSFWTTGVQWLPIPSIVIKAEYQRINNDADSGINQWNANLGYSF